jgi:hypothetical protein
MWDPFPERFQHGSGLKGLTHRRRMEPDHGPIRISHHFAPFDEDAVRLAPPAEPA